MTKKFGDFQTSLPLAEKVCTLLLNLGAKPDIILEPTCGEGNFIIASASAFQNIKKIIGVELQKHYVDKTIKNVGEHPNIKTDQIKIIHDDIFIHKFDNLLFDKNNELLIIGNPPWVTNSELEGKNLPKKSNFKRYNGLDAITGKANFDISEYILLHLLKTFREYNGYLAFLCKTQVVKKIIQFLPETNLTASNFRIYLFNAKKEFNVIVDACLFVCKLNGANQEYQCKVFNIENPKIENKRFGWVKYKFVSNIKKYANAKELDRKSQLTWRSGIKHDCYKVMELEKYNNVIYKNKLNEIIVLEKDLIFPLLKSSGIKGLVINNSKRKVIVTQQKPGENTHYISEKYPKLWGYLNSHIEHFQKRKSIIYKNKADFSIFGIGEYSFKPYKIAISGLYKSPHFSLLIPENNKTFMVDDSCYFLSFDNIKYALFALAALNSQKVKDFLDSIVFIDAKRPYTKEVLMRIDLLKAIQSLGYKGVLDYLKNNNLSFEKVTEQNFVNFIDYLLNK